jgi:glycyl-tRNA synthetase beta chain
LAVDKALQGYFTKDEPDVAPKFGGWLDRVMEFMFERLATVLPQWAPGIRYDEINALRRPARESFVVDDLVNRAAGMSGFRTSADFLALALAAKRARNILAQAAERGEKIPAEPDHGVLVLPAERTLVEEMTGAAEKVNSACARKAYSAALFVLAALRPAVDRFFDEVLVMDPDPGKRGARLALVSALHELTHRVVDMSEIVVEGAERRA